MPGKYVSPDVKSTLTPDEIRQRYRDTSLVVFKEQYLHQVQKIMVTERESTTYLSFGVNRRAMPYSNNGNDPVIVHMSTTDAVTQANQSTSLSSQIFKIYQKPRENCSIS